MPERLRTLVNHLRRFVGDRRYAPRYPARLPVTVSVVARETGAQRSSGSGNNNQPRPAPSLIGHTRDLSATGLSLILPAVRIGQRYLTGEGRPVQVTLELPSGPIGLRAVPMRYERLGEGDDERGYLVGVHITEADPEDLARFAEHLRQLAKG